MKKMPKQQGFTLLEIIVVVAIIAMLAAYIAPQIAGRVDDARISKVKSADSSTRISLGSWAGE